SANSEVYLLLEDYSCPFSEKEKDFFERFMETCKEKNISPHLLTEKCYLWTISSPMVCALNSAFSALCKAQTEALQFYINHCTSSPSDKDRLIFKEMRRAISQEFIKRFPIFLLPIKQKL